MEITFKNLTAPKEYRVIPIGPEVYASIQLASQENWRNLFEFIRLNLRSRITSLEGQDLIKLQGKLEAIDEVEKLFQEVNKTPMK